METGSQILTPRAVLSGYRAHHLYPRIPHMEGVVGWGLAGIRCLKGPLINVTINTNSCYMAESMAEPGQPGSDTMRCFLCWSWSPSCTWSRRGGGRGSDRRWEPPGPCGGSTWSLDWLLYLQPQGLGEWVSAQWFNTTSSLQFWACRIGDQLETSWRPGGADRINNILQAAFACSKWGGLQRWLTSTGPGFLLCKTRTPQSVSQESYYQDWDLVLKSTNKHWLPSRRCGTLWMFQGLPSCEALRTQLIELLCSLKNAHQPHPIYTSDLWNPQECVIQERHDITQVRRPGIWNQTSWGFPDRVLPPSSGSGCRSLCSTKVDLVQDLLRMSLRTGLGCGSLEVAAKEEEHSWAFCLLTWTWHPTNPPQSTLGPCPWVLWGWASGVALTGIMTPRSPLAPLRPFSPGRPWNPWERP